MSSTRPKERLKGMPISDVAIQQPVFITMMMVLAVVIGLLAYRSLPVNNLPDFSMPIVSVSVTYPGAGPETIAQQVAQPIEEAINTISGVDTINSTASEGIAQIIVTFGEGVDVNQGLQNVREKVSAVVPRLPATPATRSTSSSTWARCPCSSWPSPATDRSRRSSCAA